MPDKPSADKRKMFNDPVYGFITIPSETAFRIIEHPYFQRLRRIKQLGLTHLVFPGGHHTRFQHSLGAMHLMTEAIESLREKGNYISKAEAEAAEIAILLHDTGHGPYSHALENSIVSGISHEEISLLFMQRLNIAFKGKLDLAIEIFRNTYYKEFLHSLVSGQLDVDRLDYLKRDSFFCGVAEGIVSNERIIKTLNIIGDHVGIDVKGLYSVEKFILARRLMYWQVYLHKTVLSAEALLIRILRRAKYLSRNGEHLLATPSFAFFLENEIGKDAFYDDPDILEHFSRIDDFDIFTAIKTWTGHRDFILSTLSTWLVNRELYRVEMQAEPFSTDYTGKLKESLLKSMPVRLDEIDYFVFQDITSNYSYDPFDNRINVLLKNGDLVDLAEASSLFNLTILTEPDVKYLVGYPKKITNVKK
jgi:HD superfamily phosphohydrolase